MTFLLLLSRIWKDKEWLKESLRQIRSKARREKLVQELEITKPEWYVLSRYLNAKGRLTLQKVAGEVSHYYGIPEIMARGFSKTSACSGSFILKSSHGGVMPKRFRGSSKKVKATACSTGRIWQAKAGT